MFQIETFTFNPFREHTYLLYNETKEALVIDPGAYEPEEIGELKNFIARTGLKPVKLLNTHCHLDHVFGNNAMTKTYGLTLFIHPEEKENLDYAHASGVQFNLQLDGFSGEINYLHDGDRVFLGEDELDVLHAPGHTLGSICFYCKQQHFVICGDVLFRETIGRTDLPGGNHQQLLNSIQEKLFTLPDNTAVYSGHGDTTTIGYEKIHNPFL
jgi:glyoxylase-like metal-dependent hydrolase (beta-lactamase superfamily II)